ncbi:MAG: hypothetical protein RLZ10_980 [Bacteroidota bacterium]|jgi:hypothetical protein
MASTLNLTQDVFLSATTFTSGTTSANTNYTILSADTVNNRRVYSIGVTSSDGAANNMFFSLANGANSYQLCKLSISLSAGTNTSTAVFDVLGSSLMVGVVKERDSNGASFLHIPKGWYLQAQYASGLGSGEYLNTFVHGQIY